MKRFRVFLLGLVLVLGVQVHARQVHECLQSAGLHYGVPYELLLAVASQESGLNPRAVGRVNANGSYDLGLMQINSAWFVKLQNWGITEQKLLDPCVNAYVGAWILAGNIARLGYNWNAIGAYNAASKDKRTRYSHAIYKKLQQIRQQFGSNQ